MQSFVLATVLALTSVSAWPQYMMSSESMVDTLAKRDGSLVLGEYQAPGDDDWRSACPAFNAMANHGVFPRDGKNIPRELIQTAFNQFFGMGKLSSGFLMKTAQKRNLVAADGTIDLHTLSKPGAIEHDMSLTRDDFAQGETVDPLRHIRINQTLVSDLCTNYVVDGFIPANKFAEFRAKREHDAAAAYHNPSLGGYKYGTSQKITADIQAGNLILLFSESGKGINANQLCGFLRDERMPAGYKVPKEFQLWTTFSLGFFNRLFGKYSLSDTEIQNLSAAYNDGVADNDLDSFKDLLKKTFPSSTSLIDKLVNIRDIFSYFYDARNLLIDLKP